MEKFNFGFKAYVNELTDLVDVSAALTELLNKWKSKFPSCNYTLKMDEEPLLIEVNVEIDSDVEIDLTELNQAMSVEKNDDTGIKDLSS